MSRTYETNEKKRDDSNDELLEDIRENFKIASEVYSDQRAKALEDFEFRNGDQWPSDLRNQRQRDGRPCLSINKLPQFIRQVVNNQKINRPSINVNPADSQAQKEVAKVLQAIIKNIESQSMAETAYDTAFDNAVTGGEGYFRISTNYVDDKSFEQEISIKAIDNVFSVYIDPNFKSDFTNIEWAFIFDDISKEEFERLYPDSECASGTMFYDSSNSWIRNDLVMVAEYFYIDYEPIKIVQLKNGETFTREEYEKLDEEIKINFPILKERDSQRKTVKWVKTNGYEILEETTFPGEYIPIVPVFADTYIVNGKRIFEGIVRQAKDAQRAYNFWYSAETELIALAPKATWVGVEGQFEGHENEWATANNVNTPYLEYKPVSHSGQPAPPPQRTQFDPQIQSILGAKAGANEDLKAITGIYDPSLGKEQKEASGRALITKQRQAEVTNFMYIDNLCKSLKYAGKILLNIIPLVYDTQRVIRIKGGINEEDQNVIINAFDTKDAVFLEVGKYDVDVSIGPYGENQRQDAIDSMLAIMQINPEMSALIGDIFIGKQDWDGAKEISERLKIMLPPALQSNKEMPPEIQAQVAQAQAQYEQKIQEQTIQLQQMQQLIADLTSQSNKFQSELNNKQAEIESRERIEALKARTQLIVAGIKEDATDSRLAFKEELLFTGRQQQGVANIPQGGDVTVLSGVNDPITEANQLPEQTGELSPEEEQDLLAKLENFNQHTTHM